MRLFHGSSTRLAMAPHEKEGALYKEDKGIALSHTFLYAALRALTQPLRDRTRVHIVNGVAYILGKHDLQRAYVYEVYVHNPVVGDDSYLTFEPITPVREYVIEPQDFKDSIMWVEKEEELLTHTS